MKGKGSSTLSAFLNGVETVARIFLLHESLSRVLPLLGACMHTGLEVYGVAHPLQTEGGVLDGLVIFVKCPALYERREEKGRRERECEIKEEGRQITTHLRHLWPWATKLHVCNFAISHYGLFMS